MVVEFIDKFYRQAKNSLYKKFNLPRNKNIDSYQNDYDVSYNEWLNINKLKSVKNNFDDDEISKKRNVSSSYHYFLI